MTATIETRTPRRLLFRRDLLAVEGVAIAVVVGFDGSIFWRILRVAAVLGATTVLSRAAARRPGVMVAVGSIGVVVGLGVGMPHLVKAGLLHGLTIAGITALLCGVVVVAVGAGQIVRGVSTWRRVALVPVALLAAALVIRILVPPLIATNVPPTSLGDRTPADIGFAYEDVMLTTDDGVRLAAWYVPSRNGAAVVVRHGSGSTRSDVLDHGAVLAAHGYGVLLVDARGHGESGGRAMDFGWYGDLDIRAAIGFLDDRHDVDGERIGVVGMSMGGEEAIGAAGSDGRIMAVVAEGATGRSADDHRWLSDEYGLRGTVQELLDSIGSFVTDTLTSAGPPTPLHEAVASAAPRRFLIIAAGTVSDEQHVAERLAAAAPDAVETWTVPGAGHTDALETDPEGWEARVVSFLDAALPDVR